ncbi:TonB-dependent receptor [Marisediminitalea sp.]|uniref:TonB-dependent receptor n=1 Tax=Marisediminitalea sp. TaxID=2662268 RepID=UPI000C9076FE|nr:TonB-dependent receptor [Alteromonadaceae bacterium]HBY41468.1 TonB-dependent receptor [Alteromonas sp.]|tara:strand:- start:1531 stop:4584 length:3054 start_codon:yes stop_codon:yes gene_type:complete
MKKPHQFKQSMVTKAVSVLLGTATVFPAIAQSTDPVEVIEVTGLRSSLAEAASIKRESIGVVDAISAEDIGKFPDTNLAESLQRITGVSISRTNGEGNEITVRGFGGSNNMITLNGRMMPAAQTYGGGSGADGTTRGGSTRAFDFANLASEGIRGVEVYKTSKANIATGGIGATVNIKTARPLDTPGFRATTGVKAVHDTTNRAGNDVTPELSGLVSWTDDDAKFGVALTGSIQERHSGYVGATVNDWNIGVWGDPNDPDTLFNNSGDIYQNAPDVGQLYARPNDLRYAFSDTERTRTNAQLTLQYAASDNLVATFDYLYAENEIQEHRGEITNWVQNGSNVTSVIFDDGPVATPIYIAESYPGTVDEGYEQQWREQTNTLNSAGINLEYFASDNLMFSLDAHHSKMESLPSGPSDNAASGEIAVGIGAPSVASREWWYDTELPTYRNVYDDSARGNGNGIIDAGDVGSSILRFRHASQATEINQIKLDGKWMFDDGEIDFGIETRAMEMVARQTAGDNMTLGNWGIANPGEFSDGLLQPINVGAMFEDFNTGQSQGMGFIADPVALAREGIALYPSDANFFGVSSVFSNNDVVKEDTTAAYFQVHMSGELGGMPANFLAGVRYEKTDVTSTSLVTPPSYLIWENNNDFSLYTDPSTDTIPLSVKADYDHLLPSLDFDIMLTDDVKARFSYSKTIARAGYGDLRVSPSGFGTSGSTLNGTRATASSSNPALLPLESDNFDVSAEWYFEENSYASVGFFEKRVANFIGTGQEDRTFFGILDQTNGPRAIAAAEALRERGFAVDDTSLFAMMVLLEQPEAFPNGADDYTGSAEQLLQLGETPGWDIVPEAGDPEMVFRTSLPQNNKEAKLYGAELALQHFFGETGFGFQANYTLVRGDIGFDNTGSPDVSQFALAGLSDTANFVFIYDKDGLTARVAYNWRDEYLNRINYRGSNNPTYVESYAQIDANVSYAVNEQLTVFVEGINITGEDRREHGRTRNQLWYLEDLGARYQLGVRYNF